MNDEQTPALREAVQNMTTMREAYNNLSQAAEAYNVGKAQLAANITAKGVEASATQTLPELAEKVSAISQESYTIDGGEMYTKQLFGSLETPNYWNLYEVLANLLSDGRLVSYGGILLAEYYRGYDSLALAGAGAGGAYVVSDKDENGQFKMYTEDTTHVWATEFDGKANRWVAYCFADEYHDFQITDTNTSPRSIFIGRKVGTITSLVAGRVSKIVVPDGNKLNSFAGAFVQEWDKQIVLHNIRTNIDGAPMIVTNNNLKTLESIYLEIDNIVGSLSEPLLNLSYQNVASVIIKSNSENFGVGTNRYFSLISPLYSASFSLIVITGMKKIGCAILNRYNSATNPQAIVDAESFQLAVESWLFNAPVKRIYLPSIEEWVVLSSGIAVTNSWLEYLFIGYKTNDRAKSVVIDSYFKCKSSALTDIELKDGYKKNLNVSYITEVLTAENIALHMLDRLADNTGEETLELTIGANNLARIMADETYAPYVAAAQAKNWTIS